MSDVTDQSAGTEILGAADVERTIARITHTKSSRKMLSIRLTEIQSFYLVFPPEAYRSLNA